MIGLPLDHPVPILTLYTNHSPIRWVVFPEGMAISVVCKASHLEEHINPLEIMVILLLLRHFEEQSLLIARQYDSDSLSSELRGTHYFSFIFCAEELYSYATKVPMLCYK